MVTSCLKVGLVANRLTNVHLLLTLKILKRSKRDCQSFRPRTNPIVLGFCFLVLSPACGNRKYGVNFRQFFLKLFD